MVTGASTANLALILVDARKGVVEQTRRHSFIASLLGIPHLVICINKMDLVDYAESVFENIKQQFTEFAAKLNVKDIHFIPISALLGDNVVSRSDNMPWYKGSTLMYLLETVHIAGDENLIDARFSVQHVIRPMQHQYHDYRGYAGCVAGGVLRVGDAVTVLPGGFSSKISHIEFAEKQLQEAFPPMSITIRLQDEIDISRGDMIVRSANQPQVIQDMDIMCCWFNQKPLQTNTKYIVRHATRETKCLIKEVYYKVDINTMHRNTQDLTVGMNDIAKLKLRTSQPIVADAYTRNRHTGAIIFIDEATNETIGAGMIL
jgi:sulfate adenylyltransferase subunit 1